MTEEIKERYGVIAAIAMVKNEQDIIEPFVRHNIRFLDHMMILDNGSVDDTKSILDKLAAEFPNLVVASDDSFGYTQSERMTRLLNQSQTIFPADYVVLLDADEFIGGIDPSSFAAILARIPSGGFGAVTWSTFVLTPEMLGSVKYKNDPLRAMIWRRRVEWQPGYNAIVRLNGGSASDVLIGQGNHKIYSASDGALLAFVHLPEVKLCHYPVRSREQMVAKTVIGWMAYLAKDPLADSRPFGFQWRNIFERIANGEPIDDSLLCEMSILYMQSPCAVNWVEDVEQDSPLEYERRYSTGMAMNATQLIARTWRQSIVGNAAKVAEWLIAAGRIAEADAYLKKAIAQEETADLWNAMASLQQKCGNIEEAEQGFRRALELDNANHQAAVNLGFLLFSQGKLQEGFLLFKQIEQTLTEEEVNRATQFVEQLRPPRKLFVDLGANLGDATTKFAREHPDFELIAVEPNRDLISVLHEKSLEISRAISVVWSAASTYNGCARLLKSGRHEASTIVNGKVEYEQFDWPQIDYGNGSLVPCFDFSAWLARTARNNDEVIVKMDIEGAEYDVLEKMIADGTIRLIKTLYCEWHIDRFPEIPRSRHDNLVNSLRQMVDLRGWV